MSDDLRKRIGDFYDRSSLLWEQVWGEHMHHGWYGPEGSDRKDDRQAQIDLLDQVLAWAGVGQPRTVLDVGCGIGGSSFYLAERYEARVTGVTLSPVQAGRARTRAVQRGMESATDFLVADAHDLPFADESFDLVWSMESAEHMEDKERFLSECFRVLRPEGRLLLVTWCCREPRLAGWERWMLRGISRAYALPAWVPLSRYVALAGLLGLEEAHTADWSRAVAPFWPAVLRKSLSLAGLRGIANAGLSTMCGAFAIVPMIAAYRAGTIQYALFTARRPAARREATAKVPSNQEEPANA